MTLRAKALKKHSYMHGHKADTCVVCEHTGALLREVVERCAEIAEKHMTIGRMIAHDIRREFFE